MAPFCCCLIFHLGLKERARKKWQEAVSGRGVARRKWVSDGESEREPIPVFVFVLTVTFRFQKKKFVTFHFVSPLSLLWVIRKAGGEGEVTPQTSFIHPLAFHTLSRKVFIFFYFLF